MVLLQQKEVEQKLSGWIFQNNSIVKEFVLKNFESAIAFIVRIGFAAEKMDHHPDIYLYSYKKVKITLSTHSEGGVTESDLKLAGIVDELGR